MTTAVSARVRGGFSKKKEKRRPLGTPLRVEIAPRSGYMLRQECQCDFEENIFDRFRNGKRCEESARENPGGASRIINIPTLARQKRRPKSRAPNFWGGPAPLRNPNPESLETPTRQGLLVHLPAAACPTHPNLFLACKRCPQLLRANCRKPSIRGCRGSR